MNAPLKKLTVTAVYSPDNTSVTAFINEIPTILVQTSTVDDAKDQLMTLLDSYIKRLEAMKSNIEIQTRSFA